MPVFEDLEIILDHAHFWNWAPDWSVVKDIYSRIPESYSVLMPFAYSYLEELIRSTTSEYGIPFLDRNGKKFNFKVGMSLIKLAKKKMRINQSMLRYWIRAKNISCTNTKILPMKMVEIKWFTGIFIRDFGQRKISSN